MKIDYEFISVEYKDVPINQLMENAGLNDDGAIQTFHTQNVLRRIQKYMPYKSGALIKLMLAQTDVSKPVIVINAPQAHYLYKGKVWVDPITKAAGFLTEDGWKSRKGVSKIPTNRDLQYDTSKNQKAGPDWDKRLVQNEGKAMAAELQNYINLMARRNGS